MAAGEPFIRKSYSTAKRCEHKETEFILESQRGNVVTEIPDNYWHDCAVGVKCKYCSEKMPLPTEIVITKHPYPGKPHYPISDEKEKESNKSGPIPEFNC